MILWLHFLGFCFQPDSTCFSFQFPSNLANFRKDAFVLEVLRVLRTRERGERHRKYDRKRQLELRQIILRIVGMRRLSAFLPEMILLLYWVIVRIHMLQWLAISSTRGRGVPDVIRLKTGELFTCWSWWMETVTIERLVVKSLLFDVVSASLTSVRTNFFFVKPILRFNSREICCGTRVQIYHFRPGSKRQWKLSVL